MLTVGSLFAGIGGLELGLERTGYFKTVWQVEYDPKSKKEWKDQYAVRVLNKHWPDVPKFGDITKIKELPYVDLICGGFPCQDISNAGKRAGIEGERSGLWKEFIRIVRMVRPKYALVENVAALTQRGLYAVLGDLSESGYDAEWNIVSAKSVGAPHLRERIFIIAYTSSKRQLCTYMGQTGHNTNNKEWNTKTDKQIGQGRISKSGETCNNVAHSTSNGNSRERRNSNNGKICNDTWTQMGNKSFNSSKNVPNTSKSRLERRKEAILKKEGRIFNSGHFRQKVSSIRGNGQWIIEPDVGRVAHGIPNRVDRLARLGNAVVPQVAQVVGEMIMEFDIQERKEIL